jgi:putative RecB family exonuclease
MPTYSYTRLETFENCPLKYKYRYIDRVEAPIEETVEAFVGNRVHEALQKLYQDLHLEKLNTLEELLESYRTEWQKQWSAGIKITRPDLTQQNYFDYGARCIRSYYDRYKPFDQSQTLATELQLRFTVDREGQYQFQGFVDRAARRADGTYEIHDYKTGRTLPAQEAIDSDRQLGLYEIGLRERWPDAERVELFWHYVGHDTTLRSTRRPEQLQELRASTIETVQRIEAEAKFEPHKGDHCDWCEYQPICPLWKHIIAMQALPPAQFVADEGVRLADQYAETKLEIDRLGQRLQSVRDLIIEFAKQKHVGALQGTGVKVNVKISERTKFPEAHHPLRVQLEDFIKRAGRWQEVSSLSTNELAKVLEDELWPPELLKEIALYASTSETATVFVKRARPCEEDL